MRILISALLLLMAFPAFPQTKAIDSIRPFIYRTTHNPEKKGVLLHALTLQRSMQLDTLGHYIKMTASVPGWSKREQMQIDIARTYYYTRLGLSDSAWVLVNRNLLYLQKENKKDDDLLMQYYFLNGGVLLRGNNQKSALDNYFKALKIAERKKDIYYQIRCLNGVGWVYMEMLQYNEAIKWFRKALAVPAPIFFERYYSHIYNNMASSFGGLDQMDSASYYIDKAIRNAEQYEDYFSNANALIVKANVALYTNKPTEAIALMERGLALRKILNDPFYIISDLCILADIYSGVNKTSVALEKIKEATAIVVKYNMTAKMPMIYLSLESIYRREGNYKKLAEVMEQHLVIKDSLYQKALAGELAEMEVKYEAEKKEKEIVNQKLLIQQERNEKKVLLFGLSGLLVLLGASAVVYAQRQKGKAQKSQFRSMIDAEQKERIRIARDLHDSIGQMLSVVKMNVSNIHYHAAEEDKQHTASTLDIVDKTIQEVRHISHNLIPEELNFGIFSAIEELCEKINAVNVTRVNAEIEERIKSLELTRQFELSIYRIVQEVTSNMLKHAEAKNIRIAMHEKDGDIFLRIADDGKGFDTSKIKNAGGLGWKNIMARVNLLNGKIQVQSDKATGTQIEITIPR